jgi:hypothetical protein
MLPKWRDIMKKEMAYVLEGLLSDPPGIAMYREVGRLETTGFVVYRSLRGRPARPRHISTRVCHPPSV